MKVTTREIRDVTIVMTDEEANILMSVIRHVGGEPEGPRGAIS